MTERTLSRIEDHKEYTNLSRVADILTTMDDNPSIYYVVKDCYLDFGLDWMWTTIIQINEEESGLLHSCQYLNPKQWKEIVACDDKMELLDIAKKLMK